MASLSSPPDLSAPSLPPAALNPPTLLIRAPTFRKSDQAAGAGSEPQSQPLPQSQAAARPFTPPDFPPPTSQLRQPSPTPSHKSSYSVDLPTYDDYEHIPQLPCPPRALSPYFNNRGHERSASVPHNDYLDPAFLDLTTPARSRAQSHQRSRTELLPAFVSQTLQRTLSRSPARGSARDAFGSRSPSPEKLSRSVSPEKRERSNSSLNVRGGGIGELFGNQDAMPLTGEGRVSAAARRRAAASGTSDSGVGGGAVISSATLATPASPAASTVKGLGSWISGAAAQVSATVTSISARPSLERQCSDSGAATIKSISSGLYRRDSIRNGTGAPLTPTSSQKAPSSLRPAPAPAPSLGGAAKATFTSLFSSKTVAPATAPSYNPEDDELCTLDLLSALPPPGEGTSAAESHKTAMQLLRRYQGQYKKRVQQVQALKQEAEVRDEELEGHTVRSKSLKAQLEAMSRTVQDRDDALAEKEQILQEREQALKEVTEELRQNNAYLREIGGGPETPGEELDAEEGERRRESRTTEDSESVHGSIFSGVATATDTPITNTTTTSSASSIRSSITPRPEQRSRLKLLSGEDLEKQPSIGSSKGTVKERCENCQGKSSSQAWIALSGVRSEKEELKQKCAQMEEHVAGALGLVNVAIRENRVIGSRKGRWVD